MSELTVEGVNKFKVTELKAELKKLSLSTAGKKADLKARLLEAMEEMNNPAQPEETDLTSETTEQTDLTSETTEQTSELQEETAENEEVAPATEETTEETAATEEPSAETEETAAVIEATPETETDETLPEPMLEETPASAIEVSSTEASSESSQKRQREEGDEEDHPAKRQKTEETSAPDAVVEGEAKPSEEVVEKEEPAEPSAPVTGQSRSEHSLRDILFELNEEEVISFVAHVAEERPDLVTELKEFMHTHPSLCKLFVRGLLPKHREMDLRNMYSRYGDIRDTRILYDRQTGVSKNIGFIVYTNCEEALRALERPERTIDCPNGQKRTIYLNLAMKPHNLNENSAARNRNRNFRRGRGFGRSF